MPTSPPPLPTTHTDPSGLYALVGSAVGAVLSLLVAFGVELTTDQLESILGLVAVAGPVVTALLIRRHAWSPRSVEEARSEAYQAARRK